MQPIANDAKLHLKIAIKTVLKKVFAEKCPFTFFKCLSYRYKTLLRMFEKYQIQASYDLATNSVCFYDSRIDPVTKRPNGSTKGKPDFILQTWVEAQKANGFKVIYINPNGSRGKL